MPAEIRAFFETYRAAFNALDGEAVARLYALPSGMASETGYTQWQTVEPIRKNMVALCELYRGNAFRRCRRRMEDTAKKSSVFRHEPNPSIERTASSQLRWLSAAAHVERQVSRACRLN
jgi:hypothetical protein